MDGWRRGWLDEWSSVHRGEVWGLGIINRKKEGKKEKKTSNSCDTATQMPFFSFITCLSLLLLSALRMCVCLHV